MPIKTAQQGGAKKKSTKPKLNMGLGKLKGSTDGKERKRRIDAAIDEQTGYKPKKK